MERNSFTEKIGLKMMCNEKNVLSQNEVIADEDIIYDLQYMKNIEETDRDGRTLLINAAFYGRNRVAAYLIEQGADINAKDKDGLTALHAAVQEDNIEMIFLLMENGADIHAKDRYGNEPIAKIKFSTSQIVIETLLHYGANPESKNNFGMSLLDVYQNYPDFLNRIKTQ